MAKMTFSASVEKGCAAFTADFNKPNSTNTLNPV